MNILTKIEKILSQFPSIIQISLACLAIGISSYSLWMSKENKDRIRKQEKISDIPDWNFEIKYTKNNLDVSNIKLYSINKDLIVKSIEIIPPSDFKSYNKPDRTIGNSVYFQDVVNRIVETIEIYTSLPKKHIENFTLYNIEFPYPLCFKIEYMEHGMTKLSYAFFMVYIRVYDRKHYKVFNLEPLKYIMGKGESKDKIKFEIDSLNRTKGLIALFNETNDSCNKCITLLRKNIYYRYLFDLMQLSITKEKHITVYLDSLGRTIKRDTTYIPEFFTSKEQNNQFMTDLSFLKSKEKLFPDSIKKSINNINDFVLKYHLNIDLSREYSEAKKWKRKNILDSFNKLISNCDKNIQNEAKKYIDKEKIKTE